MFIHELRGIDHRRPCGAACSALRAAKKAAISGDTNASNSLFVAAKDADLLLQDALAHPLLDPMIAAAKTAGVPVVPTIITNDLQDFDFPINYQEIIIRNP